MVGYDNVVEMANRAGMNYHIQPTPAVALGAYEITPLEAAGAYTIFANQRRLREAQLHPPGALAGRARSLLQEQGGRQAGARSARGLPDDQPDGGGAAQRHRGGRARRATTWTFRPPARPAPRTTAGSPATLPNCCAWSGWGSTTIANWTWKARTRPRPSGREFMKRAARHTANTAMPSLSRRPTASFPYRSIRNPGCPPRPTAPRRRTEVYIAGTQPVGFCPLHGGAKTSDHTWPAGKSHRRKPATDGDTAPRVTGSGTDGQVQPSAVSRRAIRQNGRPMPPPLPHRRRRPRRNQKNSRRKRDSSGVYWMCLNKTQGGGLHGFLGLVVSGIAADSRFGLRRRRRIASPVGPRGSRTAGCAASRSVPHSGNARRHLHGAKDVPRSHRSFPRRFAERPGAVEQDRDRVPPAPAARITPRRLRASLQAEDTTTSRRSTISAPSYYAEKSYRRAISWYKKALKLAPDDSKSASIYMNLGTAYFARKKYEDATEDLPDRAVARSGGLRTPRQLRRPSAGAHRRRSAPSTISTWPSCTPRTAATTWRSNTCARRSKKGSRKRNTWTRLPNLPVSKNLPEFKELLDREPRVL